MTPSARSPLWRRLRRLALLAALLWAAAVTLLTWRQESLLFRPSTLPADHRFDFGPDVHEVWVERPGVRLNALHLRLAQPDGVVFYLHGNAGNLASWFANVDFYRRANLDLFMLDYRGYGKSGGEIGSEAQLHADVRAAWDLVAPRYAGRRRIVFGRSLGSGLAATLAADVQPELTVLVSPYASMEALAAEHYPWVPRRVLRYPLRTDAALARVRNPVLLVHGAQDRLIAPEHSDRLAQVAPHARQLRVAGAGHNDIQVFDAYLEGVGAALRGR